MVKKIKDVVLRDNIEYELNGLTLEKALHKIKELIQEYGGKATLDIDIAYHDYSDDQYVYVRIRGKREETDDEYAKRLDDEQARANIQEQREKAEFERLAKKFSDKK